MVFFRRIVAEIEPAYVEYIPGSTNLEKLNYLKIQCSKAAVKTEYPVSFDLGVSDIFYFSCDSSDDLNTVEEILEDDVEEKGAKRLGTRKARISKAKHQSSTDDSQLQTSMDTTDDASLDNDDDTDMYDFIDEAEGVPQVQ